MNVSTIIFYDVHANSDWKNHVIECLQKIKDSGLEDECQAIFMKIIEEDREEILRFCGKIYPIEFCGDNNETMFDAIRIMANETFSFRESTDIEVNVLFLQESAMSNDQVLKLSFINDWRRCDDMKNTDLSKSQWWASLSYIYHYPERLYSNE